jgi:lipoprotein-releasing system ATP-binding protein
MLLQASNIFKNYGQVQVLKGVSMQMQRGEVVAIVGSSGAGKSTLLHILGTLDKADNGEIVMFDEVAAKSLTSAFATDESLDATTKNALNKTVGEMKNKDGIVSLAGNRLHEMSERQLSRFRNERIGFVFQFHHLLPEFTALENVCIPGWIAGRKKSQVEEDAMLLLDSLGLQHRAQNKPNAMSGGEQQRVAVARALINSPSIVMADEPTGNLDSANAKALHDIFFGLSKKLNQSFLIVTHNEELAAQCDRVLHMKDGKMIE